MSLLERVEQTKERIQHLQASRQRAARAEEYEQRANTLAAIASALDTLRPPAAVLRQAHIAVPQLDQKLLGALRINSAKLKDGYAQDRSTILTPFPDADFRIVFVTPCNAFKQKTDAALMAAWSEWVRGKTPAIDPEVLNVLSGVKALGKTVAGIQALLAQIGSHALALPQSEEEVNEVIALCALADDAWRELAGDGIAPDVLAFLRAAGSVDGASYDLLTPAILAWIDAQDLRHVLRIRLG